MKKRLLSLALCLALCLGLLPVGVLAEEIVPGEDSNTDYVASVTTSGGESTTSYTSLDDALDAAKDGDTVKLLGDAKITKWRSLTAAITLDLNGKTITTQSTAELYLYARVIVQDSSTEKTRGMAGAALLNVQSNGDLTIQSGTFNGRIAINDGKLTIKGGTFNQEVDLRGGDSDSVFFSGGTFANIWYPNSSGSFLDLLAAGYAFYDNDGKLVNVAEITGMNLNNVRIRPHQHTVTNGACACGYTCPHTSVDANGACTVCGKQFAASITEDNDVAYYKDFHTALNAAKAGDTLTLLTDVKGGDRVTIDKAITFDLNGHEIYYDLTVKSKITLKDSAGGKGKIDQWLKVENGLTIGDLLEEGYALRNAETGAWYGATEQTVGNVTVQQVPIKSVTLTALNADGTDASTSIPYGTTNGIKLSASCDVKPGAGELSCQWYTIGGTLQLIKDAKGTEYNLPADLSVGEHSYCVTFTADGYSKSAEITITVTKIDIAKVPEDKIELELVYGGNVPYNINGATNADGVHATTMALSMVEPFTVNGIELTEDDYTLEGNVQYGVGEYTLKINVDTAIYTGSIERTWHVIPRKLGLPGFPQGDYEKTYDGETALPESIKDFNGYFEAGGKDSSLTHTVLKQSDYTLTNGAFENATVGEDKRISFMIQLKNKNYEFNTSYIEGLAKDGVTVTADSITYTNCIMPRSVHFNITPDTMPDFDKEVTLDIVNNHADTYTVDLSALLPKLESPRTYGEIEYSQPTVQLASGYYTDGNAKVENGKLILTIDKNPVTTTGPIGTVTVQVTTTNYTPVTLTVNLQAVNKRRLGMFVSVATDPVVYGMTLGDIKLSADATVDGQVIPGTIAWDDPLTTVPAAGQATYRWTFTPDDTMHYLTASNTINFLVDKATPTGAPAYTAITTGGKKLSDADLTTAGGTFSVPGHVQWVEEKEGRLVEMDVDTEVKANTAYTWKFMPYDENYTGLTGTITLWHKSSSGSSSGSVTPGTKTDTVKNPDGSTTKTETKADGSKTETTTASSGGGSTGTTVTKTDAKGNTTTEASAKLSDQDVKEAQEKGEAVTVPVKGIAAAKDANAATKIKIDVPNNANKTTVEIPVENVTSGTVAVIVHEDGTEELVKDSKPTEHGVQLELSGSTTVKIIDNSKTFDDTKDHWSRDEVNFVAARELFNGVGGNQFGVSQPMTRGMVNTVLARLAGVDTTPGQGQAWYEVGTDWAKKNGISDGTNPTAPVTREQLATLLYRYAGSPSVSGTLHAADAASVSDYAEDALLWANQNGIVNGVGSNTIAPKDNAQRAQVAAMLARYLQNQ